MQITRIAHMLQSSPVPTNKETKVSTAAFDTLKFVQRLELAGIAREQAIALAEAQKESLSGLSDEQLATKSDIHDIRLKLVEHDGQFTLLKWMMGLLVAGVLSLVLKAFLP